MERLRRLAVVLVRIARTPRQPLVGVALCGAVGIALADAFWPRGPLLPLAGFLTLVACWLRWGRAWLCWLAVVAGFAGLHVFRQQNVSAEALARRLGDGPKAVRAVGRVVDEPRVRAGTTPTARFTLALESVEFDGRVWPSRAPVAVGWPLGENGGALPAWGDRVELVGTARNLGPPRNPGGPDFAALARRRGVRSELRAGRMPGGTPQIVEPARGPRAALGRAATQLRGWMAATLARDLRDDPEAAAVVRSMILGLSGANNLEAGDDEGVERGPLGQALQETGLLHFFAVDGLKVGLLVGLGVFALQLGGLRREIAGVVAVPALLFYALATGLGPASLRATVMAGVFWLGLLRDRPTRAANNLGAAAALLLLWDTHQLFSRGFQLSFFVVAVILWLERPLRERFMHVGAPDPFIPRPLLSRFRRGVLEPARRAALGLVGVSFAAWLGSLPLMVYWFHLVSVVSIPANVLAFPLALAVLVLGTLALAVGTVSHVWTAWINNANWLCAKAFIALTKAAALVPGGHFYTGGAADYPTLTPWREIPVAELTLFDLARGGNAGHLRAGGADWLLDASRTFDFETVVRPALRARGVNRLDALLLRQDDVAHAGAAPVVLTEFRPRRLLEGPLPTTRSPARREWNAVLAAAGRSAAVCQRGDTLAVSRDVTLRVLSPVAGLPGRRLVDDRGLVLGLRAAGCPAGVLLMGNAGGETERWLLANVPGGELRHEVLVYGAHREGTAGSAEFLRAVAPRLIVFQANFLGAPGNAPLLLTDREAAAALGHAPQTLRSETDGAILLRLRRGRLEATGFASGRTVVLE